MSNAVMRFSALGDLAATLPVLRALRETPAIVTSPLGYELFKDEFDDFILLPDKRVSSVLRLVWQIRRRRFDQMIDLQNNDRSRIMGHLINARVFDNRQVYAEQPVVDLYAAIAQPSGLLGEIDMEFVPRNADYIVLNCGSSPRWTCKRLPDEKWQFISRQLQERFGAVRLLLTGDRTELDYLNALASTLAGHTEVVAGKTTLGELKQLLTNAMLTVSTDSAAMHLSAVQKTPTIGLFGPTNWVRAEPFGPWSVAVFDRVYYADETPPAKNTPHEANFFDHIDISQALNTLAPYLPA